MVPTVFCYIGKREAEDSIEKLAGAKKQKKDNGVEQAVQKQKVEVKKQQKLETKKKKKEETSSSESSSSSDSDEEPKVLFYRILFSNS